MFTDSVLPIPDDKFPSHQWPIDSVASGLGLKVAFPSNERRSFGRYGPTRGIALRGPPEGPFKEDCDGITIAGLIASIAVGQSDVAQFFNRVRKLLSGTRDPRPLRIYLDLCHAALSPADFEQAMRTQGRIRSLNSLERRIEDEARAEAERQARRIPWLTLLEYRKQHIEWEAFTLWAHAIEESEHRAPGWLCRMVEGRCPGIKFSKGTKLWKCLDTWKPKTIFAKPNREGWMRGVTFFAVRDLAYAQNWAYWGYCEQQWSIRRPASYPSFEDWMSAADNCSDEVLDSSGLREERKELVKAARRAGRERLERVVGAYLEIEAFACWLRPVLDARLPLPGGVQEEIKKRYPSLEMCDQWNCDQMWRFLKNSHFQEAQAERWFDAVVYTAELHPRRVKVIDYFSLYWSGHWPKRKPALYPSFELWRREAESYTPDGCAPDSASSVSSQG